MAGFEALDFMDADALLTEEERMVRDTCRAFVTDRVMPTIAEHFEAGTFPMELVRQIGDLGLFGASLEGYGCAGMSDTAYGIICRELERGDSGLRSFVSVQGSLCMYPIHRFGTEAQKEKWLPRMAAGEVIGCFGLTEPDHGSDPGGMETRAERKNGRWVLNGTKRWITNGTIADLAVVWAKTGDDARSIRGFLVEKGQTGYSAPVIGHKWSLRASVTSDLQLDDVVVPDENVLEVEGLRGPLSCLNSARYGIAWGAIGTMLACFSEAREYAQTRTQFGRPIGQFQLTQKKLADLGTELTKAQLLASRLGRLKEAGKAGPQHISMVKRNNVYWALETARVTRQILGASGITHEYECGRHMMNMESVITYEGTHEVHTLVLGRAFTGLSAFV